MSPLSSAAAVIGSGFISSLGQALVSPWALIPAAVTVLMIGASVVLRCRTRIMPFPKERVHEETQPMDPREVVAEVGDDTLAMLRRAREQDRAEAELDCQIDDMIARYKRA